MKKLPKPFIVHLSLTGKCNFRCTICPSARQDRKYDRREMGPSLLKRVLDTVIPHATTLILGGNSLGEVTTHEGFSLFLEPSFNRDSGLELRLTTNGYRIGEFAESLAEKFSFVGISFDGATKATYEGIRRYPFEKTVKNIEEVIDARQRLGGRLRVGLGMTCLYKNIQELPDLVGMAVNMGVDAVTGSYFIPNFPSERYQCLYYHQRYANDIISAAFRRRGIDFRMPRYVLPETELPEEEKTPVYKKCNLPFTMVNISETGIVTPCCANPTIMGDLNRQGIWEIWHGRRYAAFRGDVGGNLYCRLCHTPVFGERASAGYLLDPSYQIKTIGSELPPLMALRAYIFQKIVGTGAGRRLLGAAKTVLRRK